MYLFRVETNLFWSSKGSVTVHSLLTFSALSLLCVGTLCLKDVNIFETFKIYYIVSVLQRESEGPWTLCFSL